MDGWATSPDRNSTPGWHREAFCDKEDKNLINIKDLLNYE